MTTVTIQTLRCSACNRTFVATPSTMLAVCPHCGEKYAVVEGAWQNAKLVPSAVLGRIGGLKGGAATGPSKARDPEKMRKAAHKRWHTIPRRADAKMDEDGHCTVCGCLVREGDAPDPAGDAEAMRLHVCPPGFRTYPL